MTEKRRQAVIEKVAITLYAHSYIPPMNLEEARESWAREVESVKEISRSEAEEVLKAVNYFDLVDAASKLVDPWSSQHPWGRDAVLVSESFLDNLKEVLSKLLP